METLSARQEAFIRPSPAGKTLGGVSRRTREAMLICEAAGFDVVLVETVGVGQSETAVAEMTDLFMLLLLPSGGDELQGIKKGIVELADIILVNKADGDMQAAARRAVAEYTSALHLLRAAAGGWQVPVQPCSALKGDGIADVWNLVETFSDNHDRRTASWKAGVANRARPGCGMRWRTACWHGCMGQSPLKAAILQNWKSKVANGRQAPVTAARRLVRDFLKLYIRSGLPLRGSAAGLSQPTSSRIRPGSLAEWPASSTITSWE